MTRRRKNRISGINLGMTLLSILIFSRSLMPFSQMFFPNILLLLLMMAWVSLFFLKNKKIQFSYYLVILIFWIVLTSLITLFTQNLRFAKNYVFELVVFIFPLLMFYNDKKNKNMYRIVCKVTVLLGIISSLYYINILLKSGSDYVGRNEVGYIVAYTNVIFANIIFGEVLRRKALVRAFNLLVFIIFILTIFLMGFTTALLALFVSLMINFVYYIITSSKHKLLTLFVSSIIMISIGLFYKQIITIILSFFTNTIYFSRLSGISDYLLNDTLSSYALEARITMYLNSINAFLENPLFGTIWYHNDTTPILEIIGYHSYMLDIIALFGIMLGVLAYWLVFYPLIKRFIETKRYNHVIISIIAALFIILFFNNQVPALGIVIFYTMNSYYLDSKGRST